jgi:hypothetical protein
MTMREPPGLKDSALSIAEHLAVTTVVAARQREGWRRRHSTSTPAFCTAVTA